MTPLPWWLIVLIILLSDLVGLRVFQLARKLAKIFGRNVSQIGKFKQVHQRPTQADQNAFMSCHKFEWGNENSEFRTRVWWRSNLARWHHTTVNLNLDI